MNRLIHVIAAALLLLFGGSVTVFAQTVTSYQGNYYNIGAAQPLQQTDNFSAALAVCNQTPPVSAPANPVNPGKFLWDDIANVGKVCIFTILATGVLPSLPSGNYEATLTAINSVGRAESTRVPFQRLLAPSAPTGVKVTP